MFEVQSPHEVAHVLAVTHTLQLSSEQSNIVPSIRLILFAISFFEQIMCD